MANWVDSRTPTSWKWAAVAMGICAGACVAGAPLFVGFERLQGWPLWVIAFGIGITLLSTFILQSALVLTALVLISFVFCANVDAGHLISWALAWAATWIGARIAHSFLVDMSWLYHWTKVSADARTESL